MNGGIDFDTGLTLVFGIGIGIVIFLAIIRLFSVDSSLREILKILKEQTIKTNAPAPR